MRPFHQNKEEGQGIVYTQVRVTLQFFFWQTFQPAMQAVQLRDSERVALLVALNKPCDQAGCICRFGVQRGLYRFGEKSVFLVPGAGLCRELAQSLISQALASLLLHGLSKEGMIACPFTFSVQRYQKEIASAQRFDQLCTVCTPCDGVAERGGEAWKDASLQQKLLLFGG